MINISKRLKRAMIFSLQTAFLVGLTACGSLEIKDRESYVKADTEAKKGNVDAYEAMKKALQQPEPQKYSGLHQRILTDLGDMNHDKAREILRSYKSDPSAQKRGTAIFSLYKHRNFGNRTKIENEVLATIENNVKNFNTITAEEIQILGMLDSEKSLKILNEQLGKDPEKDPLILQAIGKKLSKRIDDTVADSVLYGQRHSLERVSEFAYLAEKGGDTDDTAETDIVDQFLPGVDDVDSTDSTESTESTEPTESTETTAETTTEATDSTGPETVTETTTVETDTPTETETTTGKITSLDPETILVEYADNEQRSIDLRKFSVNVIYSSYGASGQSRLLTVVETRTLNFSTRKIILEYLAQRSSAADEVFIEKLKKLHTDFKNDELTRQVIEQILVSLTGKDIDEIFGKKEEPKKPVVKKPTRPSISALEYRRMMQRTPKDNLAIIGEPYGISRKTVNQIHNKTLQHASAAKQNSAGSRIVYAALKRLHRNAGYFELKTQGKRSLYHPGLFSSIMYVVHRQYRSNSMQIVALQRLWSLNYDQAKKLNSFYKKRRYFRGGLGNL